MFLKEFPKILSALLPEQFMIQGWTVPVVVVSHSGFMKSNLGCAKKKPANNEVWTKEYYADLIPPSFTDVKYQTLPRKKRWHPEMLEASDDCGPPMLAPVQYPSYKGTPTSSGSWPCGSDIARCSSTNFWMPTKSMLYPDDAKNSSCCPEVFL
mmetsp:Transcript_125412/g.313328  ORF Transcript_125412/g.313328 Transcript_125412/m.313328 type:complete len:153 (-) Transcript_125412:14-472(-)